MGLPNVPLPTAIVVVGDEKVEVRGLSRAAAIRFAGLRGDPDAADILLIAFGCGISEEEAAAWRETVEFDVAGAIADQVLILSGLMEGKGEPGDGPSPTDTTPSISS